ncbi:MAG: SDR family oxidoreductase [Dehalococcoidia bacterium]|nr:SDR family oxidoreductase [Dehalococcoidia bacterium]
MSIDLSGKTAIVTGGSRGIGKAICLALAQAGANVVVAARTEMEDSRLPGTIHKTAGEIKSNGGKAIAMVCDVTSEAQVKGLVEKTLSTCGNIDILVNNAGVLHGASFLQTEVADFENLWRVNVLGPFLCTQAVLPHMMQRKNGSIVNISSGLAESAHPRNNIYSATKAALNRMMVKLAGEIADYNIAVNQLNPGMIASEGMALRVPAEMLERLPKPSIVGVPVVWLAAQNGSFTGRIVNASDFGVGWGVVT